MIGPRNDLTQERVRDLFDYDSDNGWLIGKKDENGRVVNRPICRGYGYVRIDGKMFYSHQIIWLWHYGTWPEGEIDHLDQNPMNSRIENLYIVIPSEDTYNLELSFHDKSNKS